MTKSTRPPVALTVGTLEAAETAHRRLAHNALAWSMLHSRHARIIRAYSGVPNGQQRGETAGGAEWQVIQGLNARIAEQQIRQGLAPPGSAARSLADAALDRMEAHRDNLQSQLNTMSSGPGIPAGHRNQYNVTVPQLEARIIGEDEQTRTVIADLATLTVTVDDRTPRFDEYRHTDPEMLTGPWPLYRPRGDKTGMRRGDAAAQWHLDLMAALWPRPELLLPALLERPDTMHRTSPPGP